MLPVALPEAQLDALAVVNELVLENGQTWGDCAAAFQHEDAVAIFSPTGPNIHFLTRPRGGSKTTDIAAIAIGWLVAEARERSHAYVVATNAETAAEVIDAAAGLIVRTPELSDYLAIESERIISPNGAAVSVIALSETGAWGKRDAHLLICDEFAQWPDTRGPKRVWTAIRTTVPKTPGCRLVILTSAGEPSHWSYRWLQTAYEDPEGWRVHEVPGPVPWQDPKDLARLERELLPSEYERLVLNIWSEAEDRAISSEDYEAACRPGFHFGTAPPGLKGGGTRYRHPQPGHRYIITVDIGTKNDATVMCVAHLEEGDEGRRYVVIDHLERWQGSRKHVVNLGAVRDRVAELANAYNRARVYADPTQFVDGLQELNRRGVRAQEWVFGPTSVGLIGVALAQVFRNRLIMVPHSKELQMELLNVRLRERVTGVTRLDHDRGAHDDQAVTVGLACHLLLAKQGFGSAKAFLDATREADAIVAERRSGGGDRDAERAVRAVQSIVARRSRRRRTVCAHRFRHEAPHDCVLCGAEEGASVLS